MNESKVLLRNFNATSDARYLSRGFLGYLVTANEARVFKSVKAAEKFLVQNTEFRGYRAEVVG